MLLRPTPSPRQTGSGLVVRGKYLEIKRIHRQWRGEKNWILTPDFWILEMGVQRHADNAAKEKRPDTTPASI
jgi:hypothetical protein